MKILFAIRVLEQKFEKIKLDLAFLEKWESGGRGFNDQQKKWLSELEQLENAISILKENN